MSIDLEAIGFKKTPTTKELKQFLRLKVKECLTDDCHELEFKREGKGEFWVGCKGQWKRGCWFYIFKDSVMATTYAGRSCADMALQDVGISELVKERNVVLYDPQSEFLSSFNKKTNKWEGRPANWKRIKS